MKHQLQTSSVWQKLRALILVFCLLLSNALPLAGLPLAARAEEIEDDMSIDGAQPQVQGTAAIQRVTDEVHSGNDSLLVTGRGEDWHGAIWNVANTVTAGGTGTYAIEAYLKGTPGETIGYTVNLGGRVWAGVSPVSLSSGWAHLLGTIQVSQEALDAVTENNSATLYPNGQGKSDYYIDDVHFWKVDAAPSLPLCGVEPYAQGDGVILSDASAWAGEEALWVSGRSANWHGAAWYLSADALRGAGLLDAPIWTLEGQTKAASGPMSLQYNLQFWYSNNVDDCKYLNCSAELDADDWSALSGGWAVPDDYLADTLDHVTIYPTTGDAQLGDYLLRELSLTGKAYDDMSLGGAQPGVQGDAAIQRAIDAAHSGNDSLKVTNRGADWHGAVWNLAGALAGGGTGTYAFEAYVKGAPGETLGYTVNLGEKAWKGVSAVSLSASGWAHLLGTIQVTQEELDAVAEKGFATLYPNGQGSSDYYIDDVRFWKVTGAAPSLPVCGVEPYAQGGGVTLAHAREWTGGEDAMWVSGRANTWEGAAWNLSAAQLRSAGLLDQSGWALTGQAKAVSGPMALQYNLEFWYSDGSANQYLNCSANLNPDGWTALSGAWTIPEGYLTDALDHLVIYPLTGNAQLGDYLLSSLALSGTDIRQDDMTVGGKDYFVHGGVGACTLERDNAVKYAGEDSLKISARTLTFAGAGWDVLDLLKAGGDGTWVFSAQAQGVSETMNLSYSVYLRYTDGSEDWLFCAGADIAPGRWTALNGTLRSTTGKAMNAAALEAATLYPVTGEGQLGDYYLDSVTLTRTGSGSVRPAPVTPSTGSGSSSSRIGMKIAGKDAFVHGGSGSCRITRVRTEPHSGDDCLLISKRTLTFAGAGWDVTDLLRREGDGTWQFTAWARAAEETMNLSYSVYLRYADGTEDWLSCAGAPISAGDWTELTGTLQSTTGQETHFADLEAATLYPVTAEGELGDYYLDDVALARTGESVPLDDMTIGGVAPVGQAASLSRTAQPIHSGSDALHVTGRTAFFAGAAWYNIPASFFQEGWWHFSAYAQAESDAVGLLYNLELHYGDGKPHHYLACGPVSVSAGEWTALSADWQLTAELLSGLTDATIYPVTGDDAAWDAGSYYLDDVKLEYTGLSAPENPDGTAPDDMSIGGVAPAGQAASLSRTAQSVHSGTDALHVTDRTTFFAGAAWYNIPASFFQEGVWTFTAYAQAEDAPVALLYNLELHYSDGRPHQYLPCGPVTVSAGEWTTLSAQWALTGDLLNGLSDATIYPVTGDDDAWDAGGYYLDDVSLVRTGELRAQDDMTLGGKPYFLHGGDGSCTLERSSTGVYIGDDSLKVSGRTLTYAGAGWDIRDLLVRGGAGTWQFTAWARSAGETMNLSYSVYLQYEDGSEDWLFCAGADIHPGGWERLQGDLFSTTGRMMDFTGLTIATLYPVTAEGQLGDYYLDAVSLVRTGDEIPTGQVPQPSFTAPPYDYDYFPLNPGFEEPLEPDTAGHPFRHSGQVTLTRTDQAAHSGTWSLLASDRAFTYSGPGWDVTSYLRNQGWGNWFFSAYAMAAEEPMTLSFSIYLRFADGTEDWLFPGYGYYVNPGTWTRINTDYQDGDSRLRNGSGVRYDFSTLEQATLYMVTGEGQLGDFYLDDVSLYRGPDDYQDPVMVFDQMPLDGDFEEVLQFGAPGCLVLHGEGASLTRTEESSYDGAAALLVSNRASSYSGAGWVVTDYLKQEGWGDWYFSAYGKATDGGVIGLSYSLYLQFDDGTEQWMSCGRQTYLSAKTWIRINGDTTGAPGLLRPNNGAAALDFSHLTYAMLYPNSDEGMMGDYYLDSVSLWREEPAGEGLSPLPSITPVPKAPLPETEKAASSFILPLVLTLIATAAIAAAVVIRLKIKRRGPHDQA